jgi:tripartite ATP-independent transporter DctM subunit
VPSMKRDRYDGGYCAAVIASGGALGVLIPPSNLMVIYGIVAEVSIPRLFLAGIIPGILVGVGLMAVAWFIARRAGYVTAGEEFSWAVVRRALWDGKWSLGAPLVILGGIYVGVFTPTEAAAVAVAYALAGGAGIYRELTWSGFVHSLRTTALICGSAVIILGPAKAFGQLMALLDVSSQVTTFLSGFTSSGFVILMLMTLVLTLTGMFMESIAQIILLTPLMLPIAASLGVDPVVFGVIMVIACEVGFLTPPVGANLFIAMQVADVSLARVSWAVLPFLVPYYAMIIAIAALPALAAALPQWVYGTAM